MKLHHSLLDRQGNISSKATPDDLEIICSDPTYTHLIDQVAQHPSCWPELTDWVVLRRDDPAAAGAPPSPPKASTSRPRRPAPMIRVPHPLASLSVPEIPHKRMLMVVTLLMAFVMLMVAAPHLLGTASADTSAAPTPSVRAASREDVFSDARSLEQRVRKSPVWDEQLKKQTESLDKAIADGDAEQAEALSSELDDMRLQKTRVRIGDVTSSLSDSIGQASALKDAPASDAKITMNALIDTWSAKSVDESNLVQAEKDAQRLQNSVDAVQKDQNKALQDRKLEEERKAKAEQEARSNAQQQPAQPAPQTPLPQQSVPRQQTTPQPAPQQTRPYTPSGGTDGVAIG